MQRLSAMSILLCGLLVTPGCRFWRRPDAPPAVTTRPAGVVREVNAAERYLVFESLFPFMPGEILHIIRDGRRVGQVRVHRLRHRPFFAADLLEGIPRPGDILE